MPLEPHDISFEIGRVKAYAEMEPDRAKQLEGKVFVMALTAIANRSEDPWAQALASSALTSLTIPFGDNGNTHIETTTDGGW